jgi:ABC-2 type transport system ATP-binding protein
MAPMPSVKHARSKPKAPAAPPAVEIHGLTRKFGELVAVDNLDLTVQAGGVFAFLGPNGAGKTTTIKMLTTLLKPTSGSLKLCGYDVVAQPDQARRCLGIVFQDPSLDSELTALENMDLHGVLYGVPREERRERCESLLKFVDLWERRADAVKLFSGGMKRRLEIARAMLHQPKVLFLDEPTLGLDPQTRNHLWRYVRETCERHGVTVFLTTHYMDEAEKAAQRIAVIDRGRIVADGTAAELKRRTKTKDLESAFIKLTGHGIREEEASSRDRMRIVSRLWRA